MSESVLVLGIVLPWLVVILVLAVGAWIGFQLIQQNGRMLGRLERMEQRLSQLQLTPTSAQSPPAPAAPPEPRGLPVGAPAPDFELPDLSGGRRSLADFRGKKVLAIFFNPACGYCIRMAPDLAALSADGTNGRPVPLVVTTGDADTNRALVAEHGIKCPVLLQEQMEVANRYQCGGTPMGYLIDEQGRIASEMAAGAQALLALIDAAPAPANGNGSLGGKRTLAESKIQRNGLVAGTPAPGFALPRLGGGEVTLEEFRGKKRLLVFSDPNCGPCMALAPQLEEAHRRSGEVQVLMVSRGDAESNQAKATEHGLTFPIGLQNQWEISRQYAMFATPVGYLIDENGIIAADLATGVEPILALLAGATTGQSERRCKCGKLLSECGKGGCDGKRQKAKSATAARRNGK